MVHGHLSLQLQLKVGSRVTTLTINSHISCLSRHSSAASLPCHLHFQGVIIPTVKIPPPPPPPHTPSIAFRHLPPTSARFSYATEGALFISAQLSTDAVSALRKVWVLIWLWKQPSAQAPKQTWDASTPGKIKEFCVHSNDCFICAGVNFIGGYKWHALFYLNCL